MAGVAHLERPQRWDTPFGPEMSDEDVADLVTRPVIRDMDLERFPSQAPLEGILKNDCRIMRYGAGDIIVREGDYGNSAFLVLEGEIRVTVQEHLPREMLGRRSRRTRG